MESSLKRRVVGALVLIALAVILVPAWLDGSARHMRDETAFVVPLPPPTRVAPVDADSIGQPLPREDGEAVSADADSVAILQRLDDVEGDDTQNGDAENSESTASVVEAKPLASWIVQVGSFASEENAVAMVARLREGGLAAFKRDFNSNNEVVYRVLVGPYIRQSEADVVKKTIDNQYQLKSFVASWRD